MSLADQLAQLSNPTPVFNEPEDDLDFETSARLVEFVEENDFSDGIEQQKSTLRVQNELLLADIDSRYAGKKTSRQQLQKMSSSSSTKRITDDQRVSSDAESEGSANVSKDENDSSDASGEEGEAESEESNAGSEEENEDEDLLREFRSQFEKSAKNKTDKKVELHSDSASDEEQEETSDNHNETDGDDDGHMAVENEDEAEMSDTLGDNTMQTFSKMHLDEDAERGAAVKSQLRLWDAFLECRIKLQKVLLNANQLPQHDVWSSFCQQGGQDYKEAAQSSQKSIKCLLDSFIELQMLLLSKNSETRKLGKAKIGKKNMGSSDEEIPSDTEDELADTESDSAEENVGLKRKLKCDDYSEFLSKKHASLNYFRNSTIQKWNDKTKVSSGKVNKSFSSFEQSALKQIEQILQDEDRLVRRTQLKRSSYELLGKSLALDIDNGTGQTVSGQEAVLKQDFHLKDHDPEIFDDNDFYHQLLRELIERKTVDVQDPVVLGRQWLEIQRLRSKMKRKIDTRASKGRKIRFDIHPKLTNFMAPIDKCTLPEESRNELFSSLFGRRSLKPDNFNSLENR